MKTNGYKLLKKKLVTNKRYKSGPKIPCSFGICSDGTGFISILNVTRANVTNKTPLNREPKLSMHYLKQNEGCKNTLEEKRKIICSYNSRKTKQKP